MALRTLLSAAQQYGENKACDRKSGKDQQPFAIAFEVPEPRVLMIIGAADTFDIAGAASNGAFDNGRGDDLVVEYDGELLAYVW